MTVRRALAVLGAVLGAALAALLLAAGPAAAAPEGPAHLRLAHLSPDAPAMDVHVAPVADPSDSFVVPALAYGEFSDHHRLEPGSYVIGMRAAGDAPDTPPVVSTTLDARPGAVQTVAGTGLRAELALTVLDDGAATPPPGRAAVRVVNAASGAPAVDVSPGGGGSWATGVQFGRATGYLDYPAGTWDVTVSAAGRAVATLPVTLGADSGYTVLVVDRDGTPAAELHRDSVDPGAVPAAGGDPGLGVGIAVAAAAVLLAGLLLVRRASRSRADR